jgi:putative peptidoglycan lipid II flippase
MPVEPASAGQEPPREPIHEASLGRNVTIVGGAALASRIAGFVRDMFVAAMLGAGAVADAYVAAFLIPNLFRRLIGEGAFNAAYVPIFTRRRAEGGKESAARFAGAALSLLVVLGVLILLVAEFAMPAIIAAIAPGFVGDARKFADAVAFGRILFPFVAVVLVVALFTGTLNAIGRYAVAAATPLILNLLLIGALLYAMAAGLGGGLEAGFLLAWTVLAAGCLNLLIVAAATWRAGWRI